MKTQLATHQDPDHEIFSLIERGVNAWKEAAAAIRYRISEDKQWPQKFCSKYPQFSQHFLKSFSRIGVSVAPMLSIAHKPGPIALSKLPIEIQELYLGDDAESILMLVPDGGKWSMLPVNWWEMSKAQAEQVFASDHIRDEGEQRAWMKSMETEMILEQSMEKASNPKASYGIRRGVFEVHEPQSFTRRQIAQILVDMEK